MKQSALFFPVCGFIGGHRMIDAAFKVTLWGISECSRNMEKLCIVWLAEAHCVHSPQPLLEIRQMCTTCWHQEMAAIPLIDAVSSRASHLLLNPSGLGALKCTDRCYTLAATIAEGDSRASTFHEYIHYTAGTKEEQV
eukprot:1138365-Pelagomonas_calceolata.AAC.8